MDKVVVLHDPGVDIVLELGIQEPRVLVDLRVPFHRSRAANREKVADVISVSVISQELVNAVIEIRLWPVCVEECVAFTAAAAAARVDVPGWGWGKHHPCAWVVRDITDFIQGEVVRHGVEAHTNNDIG